MVSLAYDPSTEMQLELKYGGGAAETGRMSAKELGPAIVAMANLLERTAEILYKGRGGIRVDVQGNFKKGSFEVNFLAAVANEGELMAILTRAQVDEVARVLGLTTNEVTPETVIGLIRLQAGRKVKEVETEKGAVHLTFEGDEVRYTTRPAVFEAYRDLEVRSSIDTVVSPLPSENIGHVSVGAAVIERKEARYFSRSLTPAEELNTREFPAILEVLWAKLRGGNKWRFQMGDEQFFAEILDNSFLEKLDRREVGFLAHDYLDCTLRIVSRKVGRRIVNDRYVVKVHGKRAVAQEVQGDLLPTQVPPA